MAREVDGASESESGVPAGGPVAIGPCAEGDWGAVIELLMKVYVGEGWTGAEHALKAYRRERLEPAGVVLTARDAGGVLGVVVLPHRGSPLMLEAKEGEAEFRMLAVDPRARGRRVGEMLVAECLRRAALPPLSARSMVLWTQVRMAAARRLYERMGFRRAPERDVGIPVRPIGPGGRALELMVYWRALEGP